MGGGFNLFLVVLVAILIIVVLVHRANLGLGSLGGSGEGFATGERPCAVYYTSETERCDDKLFNLPNGQQCKLNFAGWKQYPYNNQEPPELNTADAGIANRANPADWAWCFKPDVTAKETISRIGNRAAIEADGPFNNLPDQGGKTFARMKFKTLDYNALRTEYCNSAIVDRPNFVQPTGAMLAIGTGGGAGDALSTPFGVYMLTNDGVIRNAYADVVIILKKLFKETVSGNSLQYLPKTVDATYYNLRIDPCGRPEVLAQYQEAFSIGKFSPPPLTLIRSSGPGSDLFGDVDAINARKFALGEQARELIRLADKAAANLPPSDAADFAPGVILKTYDAKIIFTKTPIAPWAGGNRTWPMPLDEASMNSTSAEIAKAITPNVRIVPNPMFSRGDPSSHHFYLVEGYLLIKNAGSYQFKINSDDAGDMQVGNTIVATHYNYHGPDDAGSRKAPIKLQRGYHRFRVRVHEGGGWEAMIFQWRTPASDRYVSIPEEAMFYDKYYDMQADGKAKDLRRRAAAIDARVSAMDNAIAGIDKKVVEYLEGLMKTMAPAPTLFAEKYISNDKRVYIGVGSIPDEVPLRTVLNMAMPAVPERQLLVDKPLDLATYTSLPAPRADYNSLPNYTIAMWLRVARGHGAWRNVLVIGEGDSNRTPGIYIYPDGTGRVHFRQASTQSSNDGLDIGWDTGGAPLGEWYHFAAVVTPRKISLYLNGVLARAPLTLPEGHNFVWGSRNKKLHLGLYPQNANGPLLIQKLNYMAGEMSAEDIGDLAAETIDNSIGMISSENASRKLEGFDMKEVRAVAVKRSVSVPVAPVNAAKPIAPTVEEAFAQPSADEDDYAGLFDRVTKSGPYYLKVGNKRFNVYVDISYGAKWLLVLNYHRLGTTYPALAPQEWDTGEFPIFTSESLTDTGNEAGSKSWGHLTPDFLSRVDFNEMRFYAKSNNERKSVIHFKTSDPDVIAYATSGRGAMPGTFAFDELPGHNATLPKNNKAPQCGGGPCIHANQGVFALTNHPFWRWGQAHWNIGTGNRWEVDDFVHHDGWPAPPVTTSWNNNTYHSVWVKIRQPPDPSVARVNFSLGGPSLPVWSSRQPGESDHLWATRIWCAMSGECGWGGGIYQVLPNVVGKQVVSFADLQQPCNAIAGWWTYLKPAAKRFGCYPNERFENREIEKFEVDVPLNGTRYSYELGPWNMAPWYNTGFADKVAKWIWNTPNAQGGAPANISITFQCPIKNNTNVSIAATLHIIVDDWGTVSLNNGPTSKTDGGWWQGAGYPKVQMVLKPGVNVLKMVCVNGGGPAGFIYSLIDNNTGLVLARSTKDTVYI